MNAKGKRKIPQTSEIAISKCPNEISTSEFDQLIETLQLKLTLNLSSIKLTTTCSQERSRHLLLCPSLSIQNAILFYNSPQLSSAPTSSFTPPNHCQPKYYDPIFFRKINHRNEIFFTLSYQRCGFNPWSRKSPRGEYGNPLQYCLENPMDRGAWQATVHITVAVFFSIFTALFTHHHNLVLEYFHHH